MSEAVATVTTFAAVAGVTKNLARMTSAVTPMRLGMITSILVTTTRSRMMTTVLITTTTKTVP